MWVTLMVFSIIILGVGIFLQTKNERYSKRAEIGEICIYTGSLGGLAFSLLIMIFLAGIVQGRDIQQQITMYQEENQVIEQQINVLVENYMEYEGETFKEFTMDESMMIVSLYPELKSDQLVVKQMDIYAENNAKIKELKEELIDINSDKWWIYFGGNK